MKFTKEEISLCKQIAEKHRKEVEYGDWFIMPSDPHLFPTVLESSPAHKLWQSEINKKAIPLWTISDCLEFLKSKSFYGGLLDRGKYYVANYTKAIIGEDNEDLSIRVRSGTANTPLEACLKAAIAVLGEEAGKD